MKAIFFVVLAGLIGIVASDPLASMDSAMEEALFRQELYMNATCRKFLSC